MKITILVLLVISNVALAFEGTITPSSWEKQFRAEFPKEFCQDSGYFVRCHSLQQHSCKDEVGKVLNSCIDRERVPASLDVIDAVAHSEAVGRCVGEKLEGKFKKLGSPDCDVRSEQ